MVVLKAQITAADAVALLFRKGHHGQHLNYGAQAVTAQEPVAVWVRTGVRGLDSM
jgi:hypothetical protein